MRRYSLKSLFNIILILSILTLVILQLISLQTVFHQINQERTAKTDDYVTSTANFVMNNIKNTMNLQNTLSSDASLIYYLCGDNQELNKWTFQDDVLKLRSFSSMQFYVALYDSIDQRTSFSPDLPEHLSSQLDSFYENYIKDGVSFQFYKPEKAIFNEIYIITFSNVTRLNTTHAAIDSLGTLVVLSKINVVEISHMLAYDSNLEIRLENPDGDKIYITPINSDMHNPTTKVCPIVNTDWTVVGNYIYSYRQSPNSYLIWVFMLEPIILLLFIMLFQMVYRMFVNRPIDNIVTFLNDYLILKKDTQLEEHKTKEFNMIIRHINSMIQKNEKLSREILKNQQNLYERELEKKNTLFYALQAQVNPHFLYNTLDCIKSIAYIHKIPEIVDMSIALSHIMRYSISDNFLVTIQDEIETLNQYYTILNIRQPGRHHIHIDIPASYQSLCTIKMILQPIVENAVKHNRTCKHPIHIHVRCYQNSGNLILEVRDNGNGIPKQTFDRLCADFQNPNASLINSTHIGLRNIHYRIRLQYGEQYGVLLDTQENLYTVVSLHLPIICNDDEKQQ